MAEEQTNSQGEVAALIVDSLKLEMKPEDIDPKAMLFGDEGLGLDSIDVLELAFAISKQYSVEIKSDNDENIKIFESLTSLSQYIDEHKKK